MTTDNTIEYFQRELRDRDLYIKVAEMLDYISAQHREDFFDVKNKYRNPELLSEEVAANIIEEYGFNYINEIADTLTQVETDILLHFISLVHFLKGHRTGLELILRVLGFEFVIEEWWEQTPKGTPMTFNMDILMNLTIVPDVFETLTKIRNFVEHYVYPKFEIANLVYDFDDFVGFIPVISGFIDYDLEGEITGTL